MSVKCRVLYTGECEITQYYKAGVHNGMDLVSAGFTTCGIVAHSDGEVVAVERNINYNTYPQGPNIYGNYVKIKHKDGYYTLYAHLCYDTIPVNVGDKVKKGDYIGWMGNTGYSAGGHLHWEVRNENDIRIDPEPYLDNDLPNMIEITPNVEKDTSKDQVEVLYNDLNVRVLPTIKADSLGFAHIGYYNVLETSENDGYKWFKIADDNYIAYSDEWAVYYPKEETDYKKLYEEQLEKNKLLETEINVLKDKIDKAIKDLT